jgi:hypothetical protein
MSLMNASPYKQQLSPLIYCLSSFIPLASLAALLMLALLVYPNRAKSSLVMSMTGKPGREIVLKWSGDDMV